jgi:hypothetical protein
MNATTLSAFPRDGKAAISEAALDPGARRRRLRHVTAAYFENATLVWYAALAAAAGRPYLVLPRSRSEPEGIA